MLTQTTVVTPKKYINLPLGDVKPGGWLQDLVRPVRVVELDL